MFNLQTTEKELSYTNNKLILNNEKIYFDAIFTEICLNISFIFILTRMTTSDNQMIRRILTSIEELQILQNNISYQN